MSKRIIIFNKFIFWGFSLVIHSPDLKMAMELQEQELGEDIGFEVL